MRGKQQRFRIALVTGLSATAIFFAACVAISVNPTCPAEIEAGASIDVRANEQNAGAIPKYLWEAFPATAGRFAAPTKPNTTFQALTLGEVVLRLTASDGLFQQVVSCETAIVAPAGLAVSVRAEPVQPRVGEITNLICESIGGTEATVLTIEQIEGIQVALTSTGTGTARFVPDETGELQFRCEGRTARGRDTAEAEVTVTVVAPPPDNTNDNDNDNGNDNGNANANDNDNDNGNDNDNSNSNDNGNTNANDNSAGGRGTRGG